jgi:FKBP-type peptidyl-prolyl cis-trans isomerase FkpA
MRLQAYLTLLIFLFGCSTPKPEVKKESELDIEKRLSKEFMDEHLRSSGWKRDKSGYAYKIHDPGVLNKKPTTKSTVTVHYHGTLRQGKIFDSSVDRGEPATFSLEKVIPCWQMAVTRLGEGGKMEVLCPSDLAYLDGGLRWKGVQKIPGGTTLKFEIALIKVQD